MTPFQVTTLLSEAHSDEGVLLVLVRRRTCGYVDAPNWRSAPSEWAEAGGVV